MNTYIGIPSRLFRYALRLTIEYNEKEVIFNKLITYFTIIQSEDEII